MNFHLMQKLFELNLKPNKDFTYRTVLLNYDLLKYKNEELRAKNDSQEEKLLLL